MIGGCMDEIVRIIPIVLYFLVGIISLIMVWETFFSKKFLPFHEEAAHILWDNIDYPFQQVILSLLRLSGLGFLVVSILLLVFPVVNFFIPNIFYTYSIPVLALVFCIGLFINNYLLFKKTKVDTPWKGSLYAMGILLTGIVISFLMK
jgi:hypothetical protein